MSKQVKNNAIATMPTIGQVQRKIGRRLALEMKRKGVEASRIPNVAPHIVQEYLDGRRTISFDELRPICRELGLDLMWLLSPGYRMPRTIYRSVGRSLRHRLAEIENAMILVSEWLPKPKSPDISPPLESSDDANELIRHARNAVERVREAHHDIPSLFRHHQLPVLALAFDETNFHACLLHVGDRFLVVLNRNKPSEHRVFALLHAFAHFLFDAHRDVPVDMDMTIFAGYCHQDTIQPEVRHEYLANKFAQLWLIPWDNAEKLAKHWDKPDGGILFGQLLDQPVTTEVIAHAVYDVLRLRPGRKPTYAAVRDHFQALKDRIPADSSLDDFLETQKQSLVRMLEAHGDEFAPQRLEQIRRAWQIDTTRPISNRRWNHAFTV